MHTVINLTPHPVTLYTADTPTVINDPSQGVIASWPVAGPMARCAETRNATGTLTLAGADGTPVSVPVAEVGFGDVDGLPEPADGVIYIVSRATAERAADRDDVVYPDLQVRVQEAGKERVVGCRALARAAAPQTEFAGDYDYEHKDPRGILTGQRWEDLIDGQIVRIGSPLIEGGFVGVSIGPVSVALHREAAEEMHEALGYARHRAGRQSCPDCGNFGEPVKSGASMWSCINGHTWDMLIAMDMIRQCMACGGYGNV